MAVRRRGARGFTLIELIMTMVISAVIAGAFVSVAAPQLNVFFFLPQRLRVQSAAADLMDAVIEGDAGARGLRFAGPVGAAAAITAANATSLTYTYADPDGTTTHTVALSLASSQLSRTVDAAAAQTLPYYANTASGFVVEGAEGNFFKYFDLAGTEFTPAPATLANIYRVDIATRVRSGSGLAAESEGSMVLKSGVNIKHYIA